MKLSGCVLLSLLIPVASASSTAAATVSPVQVSFEKLLGKDAILPEESPWSALVDVGMISVTGVPDLHKEEMFVAMQSCLPNAPNAQEQDLPDGARRRSLATHSVPGGIQPLTLKENPACEPFEAASLKFRQAVATVTQVFADRLTEALSSGEDPQQAQPLLVTPQGYKFDSFADVVENGDHLEHFHSYQRNESSAEESSTIDWHTDQGLFIVFTPGLLMNRRGEEASLSDGFFIKQHDGSQAQVRFRETDDLVIILGDGVKQIADLPFRATPHALQMSPTRNRERLWYGRMVLAPSGALHPQEGETFGQIRDRLAHRDSASTALGCSSSAQARSLETTLCEDEGTLRCWHRCMSHAEHDTSVDECEQRGLSLTCTNPRGQLSTGETHGDFYPGCVNLQTAENETDYPSLPNFPRDEGTCSDQEFTAFQEQQGNDFAHIIDLGSGAILYYTVEENRLKGKLFYDGIFGWLALGFNNEGGEKNGMHGGTIIMALPGDDYSAVTGLDLNEASTVHEYVINPDGSKSAFRHWETPVSTGDTQDPTTSTELALDASSKEYGVQSDDCFTVLSFATPGIHNMTFNLTGTDRLMWAANAKDYFAGYHTARGRMNINWPTGTYDTYHEDLSHEGDTSNVGSSNDAESSGHESQASLWAAGLSMTISAVLATSAWLL